MKLQEAKLCLNCDEIYTGPVCPKCATPHYAFVSTWIPPIKDNANVKMLLDILYGSGR